MRGNLYNWMKMSEDHRRYSSKNYPVASTLGLGSQTYEEYAQKVRNLRGQWKRQFQREFRHWFCEFGEAWNQLGAIQEYSVGEFSNSIQMGPKRNFLPTRRPAHIRGLACGTGMTCLQGLGAVDELSEWELETGQSVWAPDEPTDLETGQSDPWADDWTTGTPSVVPSAPSGYFWCATPPSGIRKVGSVRTLPAFAGWTRQTWAGADNQLYYEYQHENTNTQKWACPKSNARTSRQKEDIKSIQRALLAAGQNPGPIDGIVGPKTCNAAYRFKRDVLGDFGVMLDAKFYAAIGLGGKGYEESYGRLCAMYFKDQLAPDEPKKPVEPVEPVDPPDPVEPIDPVEPVDPDDVGPSERAGFPWWAAGLLGLGVAGALIVGSDKKKKKGKK